MKLNLGMMGRSFACIASVEIEALQHLGGSVKRPTVNFSLSHDLRIVKPSPSWGSMLGVEPA